MSILTELPRGGFLVRTSIGPIQFGSPPETIKDTMLMDCGVPNIFILPYEHFDASRKISMAEIEFPIYYNFFLKNRKTHIFVNPNHVENLKTVLKESLFGPETLDLSGEFKEGEEIPDILSEMRYFRANRKLEDLVAIRPIPPAGFKIKSVVVIPLKDRGFNVYDNETLIAEIPARLNFQVRYELGTTLKEPFIPPKFGITCLGPSHGFDPTQNTSGFILWINRSGIMVDPPVNSTNWLKDSNVNPKIIDSVILTHCHADHDSGTFQKILEENRIAIYTTPTIMQSFLKKYSALTRIPVSTLLGMFHFNPVRINQPINIHGASFTFYYSLHSIPTIGFRFVFRNKTFLYSSDHLNEPSMIEELYKKGVIGESRKNFLINFPWDTDIIYHEAGIPPLHTPVKYLNSLPEEIQKKITVYHIAAKDFPAETKLKLAKFGIGETVYPDIEEHEFEEAYQILDVFSRIELFKNLPSDRLKELLLVVKKETFQRGDIIIKKGTPGDKFFVIIHGNVSVEGIENVQNKIYGSFECFGEASLVLNTPRTATVIAATTVEAYSIDKDSFLRLINGTQVEYDIKSLASTRNAETWNVIKSNSSFTDLASSQITLLESILQPHEFKKDDILIKKGEIPENIYLLAEGEVEEIKDGKTRRLKKGDFIGNFFDMRDRNHSNITLKAISSGKCFKISRDKMIRFLTENPGVLMRMIFEEENYKN